MKANKRIKIQATIREPRKGNWMNGMKKTRMGHARGVLLLVIVNWPRGVQPNGTYLEWGQHMFEIVAYISECPGRWHSFDCPTPPKPLAFTSMAESTKNTLPDNGEFWPNALRIRFNVPQKEKLAQLKVSWFRSPSKSCATMLLNFDM